MVRSEKIKSKGIFITGTDTDVGKTVATAVIGTLLKEQGYSVGIMKPIQCAGEDTAFLKNTLGLKESTSRLNPYFAQEPLSPNVAFERDKIRFSKSKIINEYQKLQEDYDIVLVEGAGGLLVPIKKDYLVADLIRDMDLEVVIVSRPGLGTINHTLLTIAQAKEAGLSVKGVIFSEAAKTKKGISERTNPQVIKEFGGIPILGTVPFLSKIDKKSIRQKCRQKIDTHTMLNGVNNGAYNHLVKWDKKHVWHPFTQMKDWNDETPLIIEKGEGSYLIDTKGNRYLDGVSSLWVNVHGHRKKHIDRAIKNQIDKLSHSTMLGLSNVPAIELAKKLSDITPKGLEKVFYSDSGSTAVEVGIKMAYQYWQNIGKTKKRQIVHLANSYHGDTLGSVSVGGIDLFHQVYRDLIFKTIELKFPDCYRAPKGQKYPEYAFKCLEKFETLLKKQHASIAAFVVEPIVQGAAGMIVWPKGILKCMRELCTKYDVLMVVDEVATGFGRTGKMFACEHESVIPDILCLAKGMTGGYLPLAATVATNKIYEGFLFDYKDQKTFFHGHTYTGNPLACAAALANIEVFQKDKTLSKLQFKIQHLGCKLNRFRDLQHVGDIRQKGFMVGIELVHDKSVKKPYPWEDQVGVRVCLEVRKNGVILRPLGNVIVVMPPLAISTQELNKILDVTYAAIEKITITNKE